MSAPLSNALVAAVALNEWALTRAVKPFPAFAFGFAHEIPP